MRRAAWAALVLPWLLPGAARGDVLVPKSGKPVVGFCVEQGAEVVFNPYWSSNPEMTYEVIRLPAAKVKRVEVQPHPEPEVFRRLKARKAGDTAELVAIAKYAAEQHLKAHAEMCWALVLAEDPKNAEALKAIGGDAAWQKIRRGNLSLDPPSLDALRRYAAEPDATKRRAIAAELQGLGFPEKPHELERHRRSALQPKGYVAEQPITLHSDVHVGATYALFVPDDYDPAVPWPLMIGLHGGGPDGKALDEVVGSGPSAMNFYRDLAAQHGFLVACPTALVAGWQDPRNEAFVRDLITEMKTLYDVDIDRVYLTGHSMGGFGTWALGPKMAADLAAISPMAGAGGSGIPALVETRTPIFVYHGSDDKVVGVDSDRLSAKALQATDLDFVYTELNGVGHSMPESVRLELFAFLEPRRRYDKTYKECWPRSSFLGKVTKDEETYFGDPMEAMEGKTPDLAALVQHVRLGGGGAAAAVTRIVETKPEGAADAVAKVFRDPKASADARAYAARALGLLKDPHEEPALRKAVAAEATRDGSRMVVEAAHALVALQDTGAGASLAAAIEAWTKYYEGKVTGGHVRISDWERSVTTLAEVVQAWGALATDAKVDHLRKVVVARVLAPQSAVDTSDRVPQDPSDARTALAKALGEAYARHGATPADWDDLAKALANDEKAKAAALAARS